MTKARRSTSWRRSVADWKAGRDGGIDSLRRGITAPGWEAEGDVSLGVSLRFRILHAAMGNTPREQHFGRNLERHFSRSSKQVYGLPELGYSALERENWSLLQKALSALSGNAAGRTVAAFLNAPFTDGEEYDAPLRLLHWLFGVDYVPPKVEASDDRLAASAGTESGGTTDSAPETPGTAAESASSVLDRARPLGNGFINSIRGKPSLQLFDSDSARAPKVAEILEHVRRRDTPPILCIHAPGMRHGLTALAIHVWDSRDSSDQRPWCYLPVARGDGVHADPTFRSTVARLCAFFRGEDITTADPEDGTESTEERLADIRRRMAEQDSVLIFDGYQEVEGDGATPHLSRLVRDEPLVALLERLVDPHVDLTARVTAAEARRTRIVVLGNSPVTPLAAHCVPSDLEFPGPCAADLRALIAGFELDAPDPSCAAGVEPQQGGDEGGARFIISDIVAATVLARGGKPSETSILLMRSLLVLSRGLPGRSPEETLRLALNRGEPPNHRLLEWVLRLLRQRSPADHLALALAAHSETGLRPETLGRLVGRIRRSPTNGWAGITDLAGLDPAASLQRLGFWLRGLFVEGIDETLAKRSATRGLEFDPPSAPMGEDAAHTVWEFPDSALRHAMRRHFEGNEPSLARALHLVLAEESIQQHASMLRHSPTKKFLGMRYHRRLLEGIVHGFGSLRGEGAATLAGEATAMEISLSSLPSGPLERATSLYAVHYRQQLEHAPDWWMTRMFGAALAKVELLDMFLRLPMVVGAKGTALEALKADAEENRARALLSVNRASEIDERALSGRVHLKIRTDRLVQAGNFPDARRGLEAALQRLLPEEEDHHGYEFGPHPLWVLASLDEVRVPDKDRSMRAAELDALAHGKADFAWRHLSAELEALQAASEINRDAVQAAAEKKRNAVEAVCDILERLGGVDVHIADQNNQHMDTFRIAYVSFRTSQALALRLSRLERAKPSGSTTRDFIRCCLKLATKREGALDEGGRDLYFASARQAANRLAFRLYRYPSERAALLILEATYARLRFENLEAAAALLEEAEAQLPGTANRPRLRMRWLLERAKVARHLAERADATDAAHAAFLRAIAEGAIAEMRAIAGTDAPFHKELAARQETRLRRRSHGAKVGAGQSILQEHPAN